MRYDSITLEAEDITEGAELHATYRLTRLFGQGGMGAVWEADHLRLPRRVAIKFLSGDGAANPELTARFRREAEIASRLVHPNIVNVHDYNVLDDGTPYLVMELLEGRDLRARLTAGPMDYREARGILLQIVSALDLAHREGVVHRDLKPENVFLVQQADGTTVAKVLDFGISKLQDSLCRMTREDVVMGTPGYMAPEQAMGRNSSVDRRTDLFSLAAIFYEMMTGENVFQGQTLAEVVYKVTQFVPEPLRQRAPLVPPSVSHAVAIALSKQQEQRQPSVSAFAAAFHDDVLGSPTFIAPSKSSGFAATALAPEVDTARAGTRAISSVAETARSVYQNTDPAQQRAATVEGASDPPGTSSSPRNIALLVGLGLALGSGAVAFAVWSSTASSSSSPAASSSDSAAGQQSWSSGNPHAATSSEKRSAALPLDVVKERPAPSHPGANKSEPAPVDKERSASPSNPSSALGQSSAVGRSPERDITARPQASSPNLASPKPGPTPSAGDSSEALQAAISAMALGDSQTALRLARNSLQGSHNPQAYVVMTKAYCAQRDVGMARAMHRNLGPLGRSQVAGFCLAQGIELPP